MLIVPRKKDAYHKMQLLRLLVGIIDNNEVSIRLCFKGGTCAAMLGFLDRFSVDLDFDLLRGVGKELLRSKLHHIFTNLNLSLKDESKTTLQFFCNTKPNPRREILLNWIFLTKDLNPISVKCNIYLKLTVL